MTSDSRYTPATRWPDRAILKPGEQLGPEYRRRTRHQLGVRRSRAREKKR